MLEPLKHILSGFRIVLASGSPRRKEILSNSELPSFEIIPSTAEENLDKSTYAGKSWGYAEDTAVLKAEEVFRRLSGQGEGDKSNRRLLVVGADTVVSAPDGTIYGKPKTTAEAEETLAALSGKEHEVHTGVCLFVEGRKEKLVFHESTKVRFSTLPEDVIKSYVASGEPMDKAGAYGIQAVGGTLVSSVEGCYFNVVGFPLSRFCRELRGLLLAEEDGEKVPEKKSRWEGD